MQTVIASFIAGLTGSMGFGSGAVLIIWLTTLMSYSQRQAQGVNLIFFLPCAAFSMLMLSKKKLINKKEALPLAIGSIFGLSAGYLVIPDIPSEMLSKLFGVFIIAIAVKQIIRTVKSFRKA